MNKTLSYYFFIAFSLVYLGSKQSLAQTNLVPNPSFEDTLQCPFNPGQIVFAQPWSSATLASTDYFNACNAGGLSVPSNDGGYQFARTGVAYAGIHTYIPSFIYREYLQVELSSMLLLNRNYQVEFYVSLSDTVYVGANNMGAYFSNDAITGVSGQVLNVIPQINNYAMTNPLYDKLNWMKVAGSFISDGTEKYITIGNFNDDASTDTIHVTGGSYFDAYYYVDDVSVICTDCGSFIPNTFSPNNDGTNDYIDFSSLNLVEEIVDIYNRWGTKVFQSSANVTKWDGRDMKGSDCSEGVYYYVFHYSEFINKEIDKKGFIQLVR